MKIKLLKFGAVWCPGCVQLERRGTLEKFAEKHPDVSIVVHDDSEKGSRAYEKLADEFSIKSIPVLIWTYDGKELLRSYDVTAAGIEGQYEKALKKAERL